MAEEIGKQDRQTPSDAEVEAVNDGTQARRVDAASKSDATLAPHPHAPIPVARCHRRRPAKRSAAGKQLRRNERYENRPFPR